MARWFFEPGHTAAEFCVRHMMVTWVRGHFKNVRGWLEFDPRDPSRSAVEAIIDVGGLWTGDPDRDAHLRSADFFDAEHHPTISFRGGQTELIGDNEYCLAGTLTVRGASRPARLDVRYLGQWKTPWWEGNVDKGPKVRAGFVATARINRHDFGASWNAPLEQGGFVVGNEVYITLDAEAILES